EITPPELNDSPVGSAPDNTDHINPGVPPVAANVCPYATPAVPEVSGDAVVITSAAGAIVTSNCPVVTCDALSATLTRNVEGPAADGVPLSKPVGDKVRPAGR